MDFVGAIHQFHFLRPAWLLLLVPAAALTWSIYLRNDSLRGWKKVIPPALLEHLLVREGEKQGRWRPVFVLGLAWFIGILAVAGPSWRMQASPLSEDRAAMFVVIKVAPHMLAQDIQPSRLQRSMLKLHDLLDITRDIRVGLVAYAGSAHLAMPLTSDTGVVNDFAAALDPAVMPVPGDNPVEAVGLASRRLREAGVPGSIVLITDAVDTSNITALADLHRRDGIDVHILAMAAGPEVVPPPGSPPAPALDVRPLREAANAMGGSLTVVSADKSDVRELAARLERSIQNAPGQEGRQWLDAGYFLLAVLIPLLLFFFRRGGPVVLE